MARVTDAANVVVRRAVEADALDVLVVRALSWRAAYRDILPARTLARLTHRWDHKLPRGTWIAEREGLVVGYSMAEFHPSSQRVHVNELYLLPTFWRGGIGSLLLETVLDEAAQKGAKEATLEVLALNRSGIAFYERRGFRHEPTGDRWRDVDGVRQSTRIYRRAL